MKAQLYTQKGAEKGTVEVSDVVFGAEWNETLVSQVVRAMQANARTKSAHAKDRSEVSGGGRKPWKQKGTGRARHGSNRSPLWVGGGKAHGPRNERDYTQKINKGMKARALFSALSEKTREGAVVFLDTMAFAAPKAAEAKEALAAIAKGVSNESISTRRNNGVLIAVTGAHNNVGRSFGNFGNVEVIKTENLNPVLVLQYKHIIITDPEAASTLLGGRIAKKAVTTN